MHSLIEEFNQSMMLAALRAGLRENPRFSGVIHVIALSFSLGDLLAPRNQALAIFQQQAVGGMDYLYALFPVQRGWAQAPNPQQFFALNYYQPQPPRLLAMPRNEERLQALGFPLGKVPENFKCEMMGMLMDNPVKLPGTGQVCDGATVLRFLEDKSENPYNRQPMTMDDATPDLELRGQITRYVDAVVEGVQAKRQELGRNALSDENYQSIHENALKASQDIQPQASHSSHKPG
jgi:hypothetical protein